MMNTKKREFGLIIIFLFLAISIQAAVLRGSVTDKVTNEPLIGAVIQISGTTTGAITDLDGNFELAGLRNGTYKLMVSYVSYKTLTLEVSVNGMSEINITLAPDNQQLGEVVVVAEAKKNTENALITRQRTSLVMQTGVSAQQITKTQDKDASEVIRRVPGISIIEEKFVMVRGLSQRYNNVWINNSAVPSSEADARAFSFDIIPSSQLDNMLVVKSPAPEYPADFSGGFILVNTKDVPNSNLFNISVGGSMNDQTHFKNFQYNKGSGTDFLGFDNGLRFLSKRLDKVRKQMFKALFSEDVFEDIRPLTNQDLYYSIQDYLNALELLPLISRNYTFGQDGSMNNAIDFSDEVSQIQTDCPYIKNADYILNRLIESIKENNKAIPFGNKSRSFDFDSDNSKFINSFKVLSILFELCRPLHISNIILFSIEKWNIVCDNLYQDYPYPCLFYSLQYNDEKLTKSVSQKILYCDRLTPYLPNIVKSLFASLGQSECPNFYRTPIMKSLSILLIGLDAKFWNSDFTKFFDKLQPYAENGTRKYDDLNYSHENFYELVTFGLTWTSDKDFKLRVISEILHTHESIDNWKNLLITKALKSLTNEDFVASKYYQDIYQDLLWLCQNGNIPAHIYVILNLITLLDTQTVQQCLERLPESLIKSDCTLIQAIPHYIKQDSNLVSVIKRIVLKSPFLWRNGIEKKGMTIGYSFIDITGISNQIDFTATEMEVLWEKMKVSLYQIKEVCNNQREEESTFFINHFATLLDEMKSFIESNTFKAISPKEYDEIYNEIISLRVSVASNVCHSIYDLLIRDETSDAISMLVDIKPEIRFPKYQGEYILLANKLVLMKSQHLNSCMNHFSWIVDSYSEYIPQDIFKSLLEFILIAYEPYFNGKQNWNLPFAKKEDFESGLIKIYSVFKKWGGINVFWQSYKPRFINH